MDMKIEKYFYVHMKWSEMFNIVLPPEYFFFVVASDTSIALEMMSTRVAIFIQFKSA